MGLFSSDPGPTVTEPYDAQKHKLEYGWNEAKSLYQQQTGAGPYGGPTYAGLNRAQNGALSGLQQFTQGQAGQLGASVANAAMSNAGAGANYGANADAIYGQYGGPATQGILSRAQQYANDPTLQGAIDATKSGIYRDLNERGLVQSQVNASMEGGLDNSRTGVEQAILKRGALEQASNVEAQMRNENAKTALSAAQQDYFGGAETSLAANNGVGRAFAAGQAGAQGALDYQSGLYNAGMTAGGILQQDQQRQYDDARARWLEQNGGYKSAALNNYLNLVGGQSWGSQTSQDPGGATPLGGALGGAASGASVGAAFGPYGALIGAGVGALGGMFAA